jgi:hypothetical protein
MTTTIINNTSSVIFSSMDKWAAEEGLSGWDTINVGQSKDYSLTDYRGYVLALSVNTNKDFTPYYVNAYEHIYVYNIYDDVRNSAGVVLTSLFYRYVS